jgi:hypothetical protein
MKCSTIRRVIDETDDPSNLTYQTAAHVEGCGSCRQFAAEREQLRRLLLEPRRVSAPANFEAMVARRLAERGGRRPFWQATGFYLRTAGAAVALACLVMVVQMARFKTVSPTYTRPLESAASLAPEAIENNVTKSPVKPLAVGGGKVTSPVHGIRPRGGLVRPAPEVTAAIADMAPQPRALLLVRNAGSEQEIAVPMVSVGAQPWVPVSFRLQDERGLRMAF